MSKVKIEGNASGTGTLTIAAPNTNTDRTLTLPDGAGEILTDAGVPASALPAGSVLQVVNTTSRTQHIITSDNLWVNSGISASITPSSTSSKILILVSASVKNDRVGGSDNKGAAAMYRNSTIIGETYSYLRAYDRGGSGIQLHTRYTTTYLDSPSTTSATTYSLYGYRQSGADAFEFNASEGTIVDGSGYAATTITLMEIAG
jgi:hypothetical protein